jgi:hypothetical protein
VSQLYERELKGILMADPDVLARVTKNLPEAEAIRYMRIMNKPFVVVRAAGSFGIDMAVVGTVSFLVEEKSSVESTYNYNAPMVKEQAAKLRDLCSRAGIPPVYAFRLKNLRGKDPWRLFSMEIIPDALEGYHRFFYEKLPKIETTKNGNYIMYWEKGMPLNEFIDWSVTIRTRPKLEERPCPTS